MNKTGTGHSILFNVMEIIEKLDESEVAAFSSFATSKRNKAKYHTLFRHLIDKSTKGITKDEIEESEVKAWAKGKGAYADLIENLYDKLLEFLGKQYVATTEATWYKKVNQLMDQSEALYAKGLRDQGKVALDRAAAVWESKEDKDHYTWKAATGRLAFLRHRYARAERSEKIVWMDEMLSVVDSLTEWERNRIRKVSDVPPSEQEQNEAWRAETIFVRLRQLYAEHFGDKDGELSEIFSSLHRPSGASLLIMAKKLGQTITKEQMESAQEKALNRIESIFMRIYGFKRAVELGEPVAAKQFLNLNENEHYSGRDFYPAASMWVLYQFRSLRLAHNFRFGKAAEGATDKPNPGQLQAEMEKEFSDLPLRLELYQILIQFGNCQFEKVIQMSKALMDAKKTKNAVIGPLKMLELLALWELSHETFWEKRESMESFFRKKSGEEWAFAKAFYQFMLNAPWLNRQPYQVANEMRERLADVKKLEEKASPYDPIHQLILWRIHGWQSGESNRRDRPMLGLNFM